MSNAKKIIVDGDTASGSYSRTVPTVPGYEPYRINNERSEGDELIEGILGASYGRLLPTSSGGIGRIQGGTRRMLEGLNMIGRSPKRAPIQLPLSFSDAITQITVSGCMRHFIGRVATDPFDEAFAGFNKQAKKFGKRI